MAEDNVKYDAPDMPSDWLVNDTNTSNTSSGIITMGSSMVEVLSCPSGPMLDSSCPPIWDQSIPGQNLGYCSMNVQTDGTSSSVGLMPNAMLRDTMFLPTFPRMISPSLPPFPHDSAFIERAARFSCFNEGSFSEMVSLVTIHEGMNPCSRPIQPIQGSNEAFAGDGLRRSPGNVVEVAKDAEGSPFKNENYEAKNESDEAEISGGGGESSGKGNKRKRIEQKTEASEAPQPDEDPSSTSNHGGKHVMQESQVSDPPKEEYIHVRARRGQATNSHSLAERIRREKISERMKFLQDLVPGCSKVTGKAVMLDEIINYVQSLQRQVEFLSMKLATVNPQLEFNVEGFLAKDMIQPRAGLPSSMSFPHDIAMPFPLLHPPQLGPNQAGLLGLRTSSETLQRPIGLESTVVSAGLSQPISQHMQATGVWEDELHNVVHNGFKTSAPLNTQDLSGHES